jgi:branched-chain amino acid transport system substrate-binding protein
VTAAIGAAGVDRIRLVHDAHPGNPNAPKALADLTKEYKKLYPKNDINQVRIQTTMNMLAAAIKRAGTVNVDKIAVALEGMEWTNSSGDRVVMRREDHQLLMPIYVSVHTNKNITFDFDNSGFGLLLENKIEMDKATLPTTCRMPRPAV